ncbi:ABC transporter ATP-binding protein [Lentzea tibetensis]|uniref:ABC transporter ATP-binding protein n=1 Tax=Lentzea tibetensis TaxID=2591470 RepID=UPI001648D165|nr:ABC transporter ATP-binding protein [Lentzea tibetensis]
MPERPDLATGPAPALACRDLVLGHGSAPVLSGLNLTLPPGRTLALLGPSGSGKTTLLHAIAGFVTPMSGSVLLGGRDVHGVPPERRAVGVVFQSCALWPHLTVLDTVAYPLRRAGASGGVARDQAAELLSRLKISSLAARKPAELSGGEQQRVALARALARRPDVFLFDEPTAHLDAHLRTVVLDEIARQRGEGGAAAVYATHDATEALAIADLVAVLHGGGLAQLGTPEEVYAAPVDEQVARLTGPVSVFDGALVRPDWACLGGPLTATVAEVRFRGPHTDYLLSTPRGCVLVRSAGPPEHEPGASVGWTLSRRVTLSPEVR